MTYRVDVDEADITVLNQNLIKSKELFDSINKSLQTISLKTQTAHSTMKPVLTQVNKLTAAQKDIDGGLSLLSEVQEASSQISKLENTLNNSIEYIGLHQYTNTLKQSQVFMVEIRQKFKQFKGIINNFEILLNRADQKLRNYVDLILNLDSNALISKKDEVKAIFEYFNRQGNDKKVVSMYITKRGTQLAAMIKAAERELQPTRIDTPYEKMQFKYNKFTEVVDQALHNEYSVLKQCLLSTLFINPILEYAITEYNQTIISLSQQLQSQQQVTAQENTRNKSIFVTLEVLDNLLLLESSLKLLQVKSVGFDRSLRSFLELGSEIFPKFYREVDAKCSSLPQYTESNTSQMTVEIASVMRRMSEFRQPLLESISMLSQSDWKSEQYNTATYTKPHSKNSTTSTINDTNSTTPESLLSLYFTDIIERIMLDLQDGLANGSKHPTPALSTSYPSSTGENNNQRMKRPAQAFILLKNLFYIENFVNRSELYNVLGSKGQDKIKQLRERFTKIFLEDWSFASFSIIQGMSDVAKLSGQVTFTNIEAPTAGASTNNYASANTSMASTSMSNTNNLSSKEKEQIKELFKKFNQAFEDALSLYQTFHFGEPTFQKQMANEVKKMVLNAYFKLYDKYGNADFTRNRSKYVKWNRQEFEKLLNDKL